MIFQSACLEGGSVFAGTEAGKDRFLGGGAGFLEAFSEDNGASDAQEAQETGFFDFVAIVIGLLRQ